MPRMSQSRPAVVATCSAKTSASERQAKAAPKPSRSATRAAMRQSGSASPGGGTAARRRATPRSLFVIVPDFSPQPAAGSSRSAKRAVSVVPTTSCTTTSGVRSSARRTVA